MGKVRMHTNFELKNLKARYNLDDVGIDGKGWEGVDWIHLAEDRLVAGS
jgi:hypothetical protein